jgi:hypothetical protein
VEQVARRKIALQTKGLVDNLPADSQEVRLNRPSDSMTSIIRLLLRMTFLSELKRKTIHRGDRRESLVLFVFAPGLLYHG